MITFQGLLGRRISLTHDRLLIGGCPEFSPEFILADVQPRDVTNRRFSNFSGDLSGRFIGALALLPRKNTHRLLKRLVGEILRKQGADGRFGNPDLDFLGTKIDKDHMPLLWGNGRLLVGLMEYHHRFPDKETLAAAARLGDFLVKASSQCLQDDTAARLESQGAAGFICFTQCNEGLTLLAEATGEARYLEAAAEIAKWVLPRGQQHSHGYLTTLRGILMLHGANRDSSLLALVEKAFGELVQSPDYLAIGGVPEYFGWSTDPLNQDAAIAAHSTAEPRDEGCSEADFLRLCFQLWRATGKISYLERAEHCLLNHLLSNQFANGDFGHRHLTPSGFKPYPRPGRAWWCCTMHALRAFKDVEENAITADERGYRVNLFLDCDLEDDGVKMEFRQVFDRSSRLHNHIVKFRAGIARSFTLALREPAWASTVTAKLNGKPVKMVRRAGYLQLERKWAPGDELRLERSYKIQVQTPDKKVASFKAGVAGSAPGPRAIYYGPWLMAVQGADNIDFFAEPSWGNLVYLPRTEAALQGAWSQPAADESEGFLKLPYLHEGFPGEQEIVLRPACRQTQADDKPMDLFMNCQCGH